MLNDFKILKGSILILEYFTTQEPVFEANPSISHCHE